jgi:epsilon-lactone hydrolase
LVHDTEGPLASIKRRIATATASWAQAASLADIRASCDALFTDDEPGDFETFSIGTMRAGWIEPPVDANGRTILFCHGGGFQVGSIRSHLGFTRRLADAAGSRVLAIEYRLAPEHKYPAAIEDAYAAYRWLLEQALPASRIALAGDSAGAALAIQVALRARDELLAVPACAALISPWLDLTMRGASYDSRAAVDIFSKPEQLAAMARAYLGRNQIATASTASPVEADLSGLPPILVHAGDDDITLDDSFLLSDRARRYGVDMRVQVWKGMFHHFQMFSDLPESRESLIELGKFIMEHVPDRIEAQEPSRSTSRTASHTAGDSDRLAGDKGCRR